MFRILFLDDEMLYKNVENEMNYLLLDIGEKQKLQYTEVVSDDETITGSIFHVHYDSLNLEIFVCNDIFEAKKHLSNLHFDMVLADVDFRENPPLGIEKSKIPLLGGLLFSLRFIKIPTTFVRVYTAKDGALRTDNPDYLYLASMMSLFLSFGTQTNKLAAPELQSSLYSPDDDNNWLQKVLPSLQPTYNSLYILAEDLFQEILENCSDGKIKISVDRCDMIDDNQTPFSKEISNQLIWKLIKKEDRKKAGELLLKKVCGHALVRYIFGKIFHLNSDNQGDLIRLLNREAVQQNGKEIQENFNYHLDDACKLFDISPKNVRTNMLRQLEPNNGINDVRLHFRTNVYSLFNLEETAYLYGLWETTESKQEFEDKLKKCIKSIVIDSREVNVNPSISIEKNLKQTQAQTQIGIAGNRDDSNYIPNSAGGSYIELFDLLEKFVCEIKILGSSGSFILAKNGDMQTNKLNNEEIREHVTIQITLLHLPDGLEGDLAKKEAMKK